MTNAEAVAENKTAAAATPVGPFGLADNQYRAECTYFAQSGRTVGSGKSKRVVGTYNMKLTMQLTPADMQRSRWLLEAFRLIAKEQNGVQATVGEEAGSETFENWQAPEGMMWLAQHGGKKECADSDDKHCIVIYLSEDDEEGMRIVPAHGLELKAIKPDERKYDERPLCEVEIMVKGLDIEEHGAEDWISRQGAAAVSIVFEPMAQTDYQAQKAAEAKRLANITVAPESENADQSTIEGDDPANFPSSIKFAGAGHEKLAELPEGYEVSTETALYTRGKSSGGREFRRADGKYFSAEEIVEAHKWERVRIRKGPKAKKRQADPAWAVNLMLDDDDETTPPADSNGHGDPKDSE